MSDLPQDKATSAAANGHGEQGATGDLNAFFDLAQDLLCVAGSDGFLRRVNRAFSETFGWSSEELLSRPFTEFVHSQDRETTLTQLAALNEGKSIHNFEHRFLKNPEGHRWITWSATADKDGLIYAIGQDITDRRAAAEKIRQSEERYRSILEGIEDGYYEVDLAGTLEFCTEPMVAMYGYDHIDEMIGLNYRDYTQPDVAKYMYETFNGVFRTGKAVKGVTWELIRKDGERRLIETSVTLRRDGDGQPIGFRGITRDITQARFDAEKLRQSEERYRSILEGIEDAYYEVDLSGNVVFFTDQLAEIFGYSREELTGMNNREYTDPETAKQVYEVYNQVYRTNESVTGFAWELIRKDGSRTQIETSVTLRRDEEGKPIGFRGVARDISTRTAITQTLRESEARLRTVLDNIGDGYYEIDLDGNFIIFNDALARTFGYSREELASLNFRDYSTPEEAERVQGVYAEVLQTQVPRTSFAWEVLRQDGTLGVVDTSIAIIVGRGGRPAGFRGIARDITRQRAAEDRLARQATELETVIQVGLQTVNILDPEVLLQEATDLTQKNFSLYNVHIFVVNESGDTLIARAGSGTAGRKMIAAGVSIPLSRRRSIVAQAARRLEGIIVDDVRESPDFLANEFLPDTRSEMAVPLAIAGELIGVLDLQSDEVAHFSEADLRLMSSLAAQMAGAIQNARSFARSESARRELDELTQRLTRQGWEEFLATKTPDALHIEYEAPRGGDERSQPQNGHDQISLVQPLTVQGYAVGELALTKPEMASEDATEVIDAVLAQLTAHLENLRLTEQAERAAAETETLYAGSRQVVQATGVEEILDALVKYTAIQKLDRANILVFDQPWKADRPALNMTSIACWEKNGGELLEPPGTFYDLSNSPAVQFIASEGPTLYEDVSKAENIGADLRHIVHKRFGMRGLAIFPLVAGSEWFGLINGQVATTLPLDDDDVRQISSLADQAAAVLQNQRLFAQTQEALAATENQARRLAALNDLGEDLTRAASMHEIYNVLARQAREILDSDRTSVAMISNDGLNYEIQAVFGERGDSAVGDIAPLAGSTIGVATKERQVKIINSQDSGIPGIVSFMVAPLLVGNRAIGSLNVGSRQADHYTDRDGQLAQQMASLVAATIENRRLFAETERALAEAQTLYKASQILTTVTDLEGTLGETMRALADDGVINHGADVFLDAIVVDEANRPETAEVLVHTSASNPLSRAAGDRFALSDIPITPLWEAAPGLPLLIGDVQTDQRLDDPAREYFQAAAVASSVILPLRVGNRWIGQLMLTWTEPQIFTDQDERIFQAIMGQFASVVEGLRLGERVQLLASIVENHPDFIGAGTLDGAALYVNPAGLRMMGLPRDHDVRNMTASDFYMPESAAMLQEEGIPQALEAGSWTAESELMRSDGGLVPVEEIIGINYDADSKPIGFSITMHDITERKQAAEALAQALAESRTLYEVSSQLNAAATIDETLTAIVSPMIEVGATVAALWQFELDDGGQPVYQSLAAFWQATPAIDLEKGLRLPVGHLGLAQYWLESLTEPVMIEDIETDKRLSEEDLETLRPQRLRAIAYLPLAIGRRWVGLVNIGWHTPQTFTAAERNIFRSVAAQAAVAVENQTLLQQTEARARRERLLRQVTEKVRGSSDIDTIMRTAVREVGRALGRQAFVYLESVEGAAE